MAKNRKPPGISSTTSNKNTPKPFIIDDETLTDPSVKDQVFVPTIDGQPKGHGLVPRDYRIYPAEMFAPPSDIQVFTANEISERIKEQDAKQSSLEHIRPTEFNSLDQNGQGYCWAYSTTSCVMMLRALMNQPYVRLSAHAIGCTVKNYRDEGGWCGLSAKFQREKGCPSIAHWAEKSMSRSNDKPETWANAALHKITEDWVDLTQSIYDQNLSILQLHTALVTNNPCAVDFNWWSHSVCAIRVVEVEAGSFGLMILNSWTDSWGTKGTSILRGSKARPDGAVCLRVTGAAAA